MFELPSVEQCQSFMAKLNEGRVALGLEPIEKLDYDACRPHDPHRCLSATHLFVRDTGSGYVAAFAAQASDSREAAALETAGFEPSPSEGTDWFDIPREITAVTSPFDSLTWQENADMREPFKARLVEAGIA